jgi:hypothetical protein
MVVEVVTISLVMVFAGNPGTGKTLQSMMHRDGEGLKKIIIDIENKAENTYRINYNREKILDTIDIFNPIEVNTEYEIDYKLSYSKLIKKLSTVKKDNNYDIIVLDSFNYLRNPFCSEFFKANTGKKGIVENDWRIVNGYVEDIVMPLAQYCRVRDKTLIIICHMKDYYENGNYIRQVPNIKEWAEHLADVIIQFESEKNVYNIKCLRSAVDYWESDVSGVQSIDLMLMAKGLL